MSDQAPASALRVVNASRVLDAPSKLLLGEIFRLDRTHKGCYAGEAMLARRVGRSVRAMHACRTKLREAGFLERSEERLSSDRRQYTWFFILPEQYWPSEYAKDEEIFVLADQLDEDLRSGKLREHTQDNRKVLDAIKRAAGVGSVVGELEVKLAKAKEREQIDVVHDTYSNEKKVSPTTPINEKKVSWTVKVGVVDGQGRCRGRSKKVSPTVKVGVVGRTPFKRTEENKREQISTEQKARTESSQNDIHKKNGTPDCPHPQGSPEWKNWHLTHLRAPAVAS